MKRENSEKGKGRKWKREKMEKGEKGKGRKVLKNIIIKINKKVK